MPTTKLETKKNNLDTALNKFSWNKISLIIDIKNKIDKENIKINKLVFFIWNWILNKCKKIIKFRKTKKLKTRIFIYVDSNSKNNKTKKNKVESIVNGWMMRSNNDLLFVKCI